MSQEIKENIQQNQNYQNQSDSGNEDDNNNQNTSGKIQKNPNKQKLIHKQKEYCSLNINTNNNNKSSKKSDSNNQFQQGKFQSAIPKFQYQTDENNDMQIEDDLTTQPHEGIIEEDQQDQDISQQKQDTFQPVVQQKTQTQQPDSNLNKNQNNKSSKEKKGLNKKEIQKELKDQYDIVIDEIDQKYNNLKDQDFSDLRSVFVKLFIKNGSQEQNNENSNFDNESSDEDGIKNNNNERSKQGSSVHALIRDFLDYCKSSKMKQHSKEQLQKLNQNLFNYQKHHVLKKAYVVFKYLTHQKKFEKEKIELEKKINYPSNFFGNSLFKIFDLLAENDTDVVIVDWKYSKKSAKRFVENQFILQREQKSIKQFHFLEQLSCIQENKKFKKKAVSLLIIPLKNLQEYEDFTFKTLYNDCLIQIKNQLQNYNGLLKIKLMQFIFRQEKDETEINELLREQINKLEGMIDEQQDIV
ncbi:hypothetical protein ABPG72_022341 [Tetrahymena utriculariae]